MTEPIISISEKVKAYRKENHLSQTEFGQLFGVSAQAVYKWENSACYPDITLLPKLADLIGCPIDDFFKH